MTDHYPRGVRKPFRASLVKVQAFALVATGVLAISALDLSAQTPFDTAAFRSARTQPPTAAARTPFVGSFRFADSAFVEVEGGILTVSTGHIFLLSTGKGLARVASERVVQGGLIQRPDSLRSHSILVEISDVVAAEDGRVSLVSLWDRPSSGYQVSTGAVFVDSTPTSMGAAALSRLHLIRDLRPLHEKEGIYGFSGRGTTRTTRSDRIFEPRTREWTGEMVFLPDSDSATAFVVISLRNEAGGGRDFSGSFPVRGGSFTIERTLQIGADNVTEKFVATFELLNGRLNGTWIRQTPGVTLEERGSFSGSRK